ncbi:MAG: sugar phosphate isomerase/epimerase [Opitutaceae bacterium]|nr:sugar phosphate isomerase/epimerase [Opitutaceae bacterium]
MILPGLVSVTFRKLAPADIVALVRQAGLAGIEWGGDVHVPHGDLARAREVRELTEQAGLRAAAYGSYYRAGQSESDGLPFSRVLDTALELGAPTIRVWPGGKASAEVSDQERARIVADLERIAGLAVARGVTVSTEFHSGSLTDTNESARQLLFDEARHPALLTCWQPHNGEEAAPALRGLKAVLPRVGNLHVFHWWPTSADRRPLAEGAERWRAYLAEVGKSPVSASVSAGGGERFALLEFVPGDTPEAFLRDAETLKQWLA